MLVLGLLLACLAQDFPDLGTRKNGVDWPGFLGPRHDGTSPEKGLVAPWPSAGPRIVWQAELGESYAACSILKGRLFIFDRQGDRMRLLCLKSETGEELWRQEYESSYRDGYGAGNGPRCCPVADADRVYTFDPAGQLRQFAGVQSLHNGCQLLYTPGSACSESLLSFVGRPDSRQASVPRVGDALD